MANAAQHYLILSHLRQYSKMTYPATSWGVSYRVVGSTTELNSAVLKWSNWKVNFTVCYKDSNMCCSRCSSAIWTSTLFSLIKATQFSNSFLPEVYWKVIDAALSTSYTVSLLRRALQNRECIQFSFLTSDGSVRDDKDSYSCLPKSSGFSSKFTID